MFDGDMNSGGGRPNTPSNLMLAARYKRLAGETTGMVRRIMWRLADEAEARQRRTQIYADVIDLHVVPDTAEALHDAVQTWA